MSHSQRYLLFLLLFCLWLPRVYQQYYLSIGPSLDVYECYQLHKNIFYLLFPIFRTFKTWTGNTQDTWASGNLGRWLNCKDFFNVLLWLWEQMFLCEAYWWTYDDSQYNILKIEVMAKTCVQLKCEGKVLPCLKQMVS